jgi:hypothetical protein
VQTIKRLIVLAGGAGFLLAAAACNPDLNITNPNNPDVARAISTPGDVRNLIGSSYNGAYLGMQGSARPYPGAATAVMADNLTASFGNFGMRSTARSRVSHTTTIQGPTTGGLRAIRTTSFTGHLEQRTTASPQSSVESRFSFLPARRMRRRR